MCGLTPTVLMWADEDSSSLRGLTPAVLMWADGDPFCLCSGAEKLRFIHHVAYNAALIYALQGKAEPAVKYLRKTADTGLPHYVIFCRDHFLDPIRSSPAFMQFMAELKPRWEAYRREFSDLARE